MTKGRDSMSRTRETRNEHRVRTPTTAVHPHLPSHLTVFLSFARCELPLLAMARHGCTQLHAILVAAMLYKEGDESSLAPIADAAHSSAARAPYDPKLLILSPPHVAIMESCKVGDPTEQAGELENGNRVCVVDGALRLQKPGGAGACIKKAVWLGGSVYDAWLNAVSAQVGQVILSMPTSYAQMGFKLGLFFHFLYVIIGLYTCYLLAGLYVEHRARKEKEGVDFRHHVIQYHELLGALVGKWAMNISLFFNVVTVGAVAVIQIIACASNAYYLNPSLSKRSWALIFGALSLTVDLLPTIHNFRVFSFLGALTTTYTSWYMLSSALSRGQSPGVKHSAPINMQSFFTGTTNILFGTGGHAVTIEIMHAMWKPVKYKYVYLACTIYVLFITIPHSYALYWAYGDALLHENNALGLLPDSMARDTALIFMIIHQAVAFGLYIMPLNFIWEKYWGVHQAHFLKRVMVRLPLGCLLWLLALMFPFFGPLNSVIGSLFMSFSVFIIPCIVYTITFWNPIARENAAEPPSMVRRAVGWWGMVGLNFSTIITIAILGVGFGSYASFSNIIEQVKNFGIFQACYQCTNGN